MDTLNLQRLITLISRGYRDDSACGVDSCPATTHAT
ncbi:BnaC05g10080D [Brassica napus]|uniref:(rape) hypothetical protein n=1 Tax=Brassica napus TaxID=3708 RepID=A0A078HF34_BRANA|nr:unnamed protein product [Brassica napus]CDY36407.1 BnaC05g10080D [Brassica napus]